jgi:hypothetical protein
MRTETQSVLLGCAAAIFLAIPFSACAQGTPVPIKAGLWETESSITNTMALPPELEAKIAAMPPAQQAQMRAMMPGAAGGKPMVVTGKSCIASSMSLDGFLNQQQQRSQMKCTFTNRVQTSDGASFDTSCVSPQGTATGHTQIHLVDDDHVTGSTHITMDGSAQGHSMHMTVDSTTSSRFLGADCGDVKPYTPAAAH